MSEEGIDLRAKFPELEPVNAAPTMFSINGFGLRIYGQRDMDKQTRTYVVSRCIAALFIPVIWLDAYRVLPAGGDSYYFLGRQPISGLCKFWNMLMVSMICVFGGYGYWAAHTSSPEYKAGRHLKDARELRAAGKYMECLTKLSTVLAMRTSHTGEATSEFETLMSERFDKAPIDEAVTLVQMQFTHKPPQRNTPLAADLYKRMAARASELADTNAIGARKLLNLAASLAPDKAAHTALAENCLEKAVAQNPSDLHLLSDWAGVLETRKDSDGLKKLLEPQKSKLGSAEAARMLGQIYAHEGDIEGSYQLLEPYMRGRLEALHAAEAAYEQTSKQVSDSALARLRKGDAGDAWYRRYETSNEATKQEMVDKYITDSMRNNGTLMNAEKRLSNEAKIVPVALDFGIVRLQRARMMTDAAGKKKELEAAEKVFLDIRTTAGESDQYLLYFGQVLFWLGRADDGHKQFEQLLTKNKRDPGLLLTLANVFRELGDINQALKMMEESYNTAKDQNLKYAAAGLRAVASQKLEDKILWLGRSDSNAISTRSALARATADKAMVDGDKVQAAVKYREALKIYEDFPRSAATLNNRSVMYASLFAATGDRADYRRSVEMQVESLALDPKDTILMLNTANSLLHNAALEMMGASVDLTRAGTSPTIQHLNHLYSDSATRKAVTQRFATHKDVVQAVSILERLLLLSPRSESAYSLLARVYMATDNEIGLRDLRERLKTVVLDTESTREEALEFEKNGIKAEHLQSMKLRNAHLEATVKELGPGSDKLTKSLALDSLYDQLWGLYVAGEKTDFDRFVKISEEQHANLPSSNSQDSLTASHSSRAVHRIAQLRPEWKQQFEKSRVKIAANKLLPGFIETAGTLREKILADPDVQKMVAQIREARKLYPDKTSIHHWKLAQHVEPALAAELGKILLKDEATFVRDELAFMLEPYSASEAIELYWFYQLKGDQAGADKVKKTLTDRGISWPLP